MFSKVFKSRKSPRKAGQKGQDASTNETAVPQDPLTVSGYYNEHHNHSIDLSGVEGSLPRDVLCIIFVFSLFGSNWSAPQAARPVRRPSGATGRVDPNALKLAHAREVSRLRLVCKGWLAAVDSTSCPVWFMTARQLCLGEPPARLYHGGTYRDVCVQLVSLEKHRLQVLKEQAATNGKKQYRVSSVKAPARPPSHPSPTTVRLPETTRRRLADNALALANFSRSMHYGGAEMQAEHMLTRYRMWLVLRAKHSATWLVPSADIMWCHLSHVFRTELFWEDMRALGIEPHPQEPCLVLNGGQVAAYSHAAAATGVAWKEEFGSEHRFLHKGADLAWVVWSTGGAGQGMGAPRAVRSDPQGCVPLFGPVATLTPEEEQRLPSIQLTAQDIAADREWFPEFSRAHDEFQMNKGYSTLSLENAVGSYERYLNLVNQHSELTDAGPPMLIDLCWHAHQMQPALYRDECQSLFQRQFLHMPWEGTELGEPCQVNEQFSTLWRKVYNTEVDQDWKYEK